MALPGPSSEQKRTKFSKRQKLLTKWVSVAPNWLKISVSCIVFREESDYDTHLA